MGQQKNFGGNLILTEIDDDHVGTLVLNRPERHNAFNDAMTDAFEEAMQHLIENDDARCILIRAEGKSFCTGRDVAVLGHRARNESDFSFVRRHQNMRLAHLDAPKPIIAAVRGYALGGGLEMALSADFRFASTEAQFAMPEINYGVLTDTCGSQLLASLVGNSKAKLMIMTGERYDAATALAWGMVDFVCPLEVLDAQAYALAKTLAGKPPIALAMAKQLVDQFTADRIRNGTRQELLAISALFKSEDYQEARAAVREKRTPKYTGR